MKITREADYAVRILYIIKTEGKIISARDISEKSGVSLRFTLKILSKLAAVNMVEAKKGVQGGYFLIKPPCDISILEVVEAIDGKIEISHCMEDGFVCTRVSDKTECDFRKVFQSVSKKVADELASITLDKF